MRTPYGFVSFVAAILAACSTVTSLVVPTDDSSLAQAPESDARPSTLPIRNIHVATRDDVVSGNTTLLHNDGSFWMAPLADDDDDDEFEIPAADQPDLDLVSRYGPGAPPDKHDPHKVYCKDFKAITDETSDASPWIEDCLGIIPNIQPPEHGAHWKFMIGSTRKIVSHKSCVLAVSANHIGQRGSWMNVGNMDVIAVIDELAMMREGKGGKKMGGKTTAKCTIVVTAMPGETEFSIFHT
ncbi:putative necrosis-inducing factor-domain-containing protein [Pseudoneurospora amorphoporcata]|uniref:Necrosis-inducing factor-domain-containing protein n=1 Tax=Pseudoneurospora amorphoporcata TaxID=241081 RepID=A0AAN6NK02_9PEZI|nr:putative necrosis-inducing factor-domain-containing protein [Pseudoneurospora amorphoporcata]